MHELYLILYSVYTNNLHKFKLISFSKIDGNNLKSINYSFYCQNYLVSKLNVKSFIHLIIIGIIMH